MLFVLSDSAAALAVQKPQSRVFEVAISRLLEAYADGLHVVLIDRETCRLIESAGVFSAEQVGAAQRIRNRFTDYGSLPTKLSRYCVVTSTGYQPSQAEHGWDVPLHWLASHPLGRSCLLCEDLHDTDVFIAAGEDFLAKQGLRSFELRADPVAGGGGNTHRVLQQVAINDQRPCICVVDSDRKAPTEGPGPTAAPCAAANAPGLYTVLLTESRMIENAIPWRLIDRVRSARIPLPSAELVSAEQKHPQSSQFLNLKRGICGFEISQMTPDISKIFWQGAAASIVGPPTCCPTGVCIAPQESACKYRLHRGYGGSLLSDVAKWLVDNRNPNRSEQYLPSPNDANWKIIGATVAALTLGLGRRRI
jgi:hypothetical protein